MLDVGFCFGYGGGRGWLGGHGRGGLADQTGGYGLAQIEKCLVGAVVDAMETGFVAGQKGGRAGVISETLVGDRHVNAGIGLGQLLDFFYLAVHFVVHESDFDRLQPANAPFCANDFFD